MTTRFGRRRLLEGAAAFVVLAGCGAPPAPEEPSLDPLLAALATGDEAAFTARFATTGNAPSLARRLWRNWRLLGVDSLSVTASAAGRVVVDVRWRVDAEERPASDRVIVGSAAGLLQTVEPDGAPPLWLVTDLRLDRVGRATLVSSAAVDEATRRRVAVAADEAARRLTRAQLGPVVEGWQGRLVVMLPDELHHFAAIAGLSGPEAAATSAAVPRRDDRTLRPILVQPVIARRINAASAATVLTHEGVHAAVRSAANAAPLWAVEGLAELVATEGGGAAARDGARRVRRHVARGGPATLPTAGQLGSPDPEESLDAYALAEAAVEGMRRRFGWQRTLGWIVDWASPTRPGEADLLAAYRAELRRPPGTSGPRGQPLQRRGEHQLLVEVQRSHMVAVGQDDGGQVGGGGQPLHRVGR